VQHLTIDSRQTDEHNRITPMVIGEVVDGRGIFQQRVALLGIGTHDERVGSADGSVARPAMNMPATFNRGDPSYFVANSTPGNVSPTARTISKLSADVGAVASRFTVVHRFK